MNTENYQSHAHLFFLYHTQVCPVVLLFYWPLLSLNNVKFVEMVEWIHCTIGQQYRNQL